MSNTGIMSYEVEGNLITMALNGDFDVIIHGCNCFCTMASGIAGQISQRLPAAREADKLTEKGDKSKLGNYSAADCMGDHENHFIVVNAYTQYRYGLDKRHTDYTAVRDVMRRIKKDFSGQRIGYPMIGAFRGGGDWEIIKGIINEELAGEHHTFVRFKNVN